MIGRTNAALLLLAALAAIGGGWLQRRAQHVRGDDMVGRSLPDLLLVDLNGHPAHLADFRGRRVLINLWATWCEPCLRELPALTAAQDRYGGAHITVLGLALDDPAAVRAYLATHPTRYPILLADPARADTAALGNHAGVLPYSVLADASGRIVATRRGALDAATLRAWLASEPR